MAAHGLTPVIPTLGTRENKDQEFQATSFDCLKTKNKQKAKRGRDEPLWTLCKASGLNNSKMFVSGFFPNEDQGLLRHKSFAQLGSSKGMVGIWGLSFSLLLKRLLLFFKEVQSP